MRWNFLLSERDSHPNSLYNLVVLVPFQHPATTNPAWYWTDSSSFISSDDLSWKITSPYSRCGRTCILKAKSSLDWFKYRDRNFKRDIPLFALIIASEICFLNDNFSSKWKQRCFVESFLATGIPSKKGWVIVLFVFSWEDYFNGLFGNIRVELHFPLIGPSGNFV